MMYYTYTDTPVGEVMLVGRGKILSAIYWRVYRHTPAPLPEWVEDRLTFSNVMQQLDEYFAGKRTDFEMVLEAHCTPFQMRVWKELSEIPYGETRTYKQIAEAVDAADAVRAVGAAIGQNPLSIVIPCHRVIASNGALTGFAGGLDSKRSLLELEGATPNQQLSIANW